MREGAFIILLVLCSCERSQAGAAGTGRGSAPTAHSGVTSSSGAVIERPQVIEAKVVAAPAPADRVFALAAGPGIVVSGEDGWVLRTRDPRTLAVRKTASERHENGWYGIALSGDGSRLAVAWRDEPEPFVELLDTSTMKSKARFEGLAVRHLALDARGELLLASTITGKASLWSTRSQEVLKRFEVTRAAQVALSHDGRIVAVQGEARPGDHGLAEDGKTHQWTVPTPSLTWWNRDTKAEQRLAKPIFTSFALVDGGRRLVLDYYRNGFDVVDGKTGTVTSNVRKLDLSRTTVSPDGKELAYCDGGGTVTVVRLPDGGKQRVYLRKGSYLSHLAFAPDRRSLYVVDDGRLSRIDLAAR